MQYNKINQLFDVFKVIQIQYNEINQLFDVFKEIKMNNLEKINLMFLFCYKLKLYIFMNENNSN